MSSLSPKQAQAQHENGSELSTLSAASIAARRRSKLAHRLSEHPEPEQDDESFLSNFVDDADTVFDPALALNTNPASFSQSQSQSQSQAQAQPQPSGVEPRLQPFAATSGISPDLTQSRTHLPQPLPTALSATGLFPLRGQADDVLMPPASAPAHASAPDVSGTLPLAPAETAPPTVGSLHSLNMAELLDPADRDVQAFAPKAPFFSISNTGRRRVAGGRNRVGTSNDRDDPVALMVLSEVEASSLVHLFHQKLNPLVAVLDPRLHTMSYLRSTSSILFSTVLASSARFFRPDLHPHLVSHASTILDRALHAGQADTGIVQSLMLLTYWKEPADSSGWMKIGMAIRLGYSLFWHVPRTEPLPEDETQAREVLRNSERTWFCLFSFDRGLAYAYGLPAVMRVNDHSDPEVWARSHLHLGPSVDMHIAASMALCKLKDHWGALCEYKQPEMTYLLLAVETITKQCDALIAKWFNQQAPQPCFDQDAEHVMLWSILDFIFVLRRYILEESPQDPLHLDNCLSVVSRIADEIEILSRNGMLLLMQDSASGMTSSLVVFLRKASGTVFRLSTPSQKSYILTLLHRVLLSHTSVTNEDGNTAPAYVARFIRRVLCALSAESRAGSPGPAFPGEVPMLGLQLPLQETQGLGQSQSQGQAQAQGQGSVGDDFFAMLGLEEFTNVPDFVSQSEADDVRYWANMFSLDFMPQPTG
ncbi:hypothetical protein EHS25_005301 [Saitozyma podzolica]|uniref:Xylanolytic transcriptional activator regulatory domain-containing protein n=1 Tax=Saitozyma podzolica TaxID=1890683 RepID=A0A427XYV1_9TREE|nr:hypothetical protein EHS25_005301 [Saitozyma podzolica]